MSSERTRLSMPRLEHADLDGFSLYTQRPHVSASFGPGVFCLAGANGLGKSTFLAALSFGLTGVVAPDNPKFKSIAQYYTRCVAYSRKYFDGRIVEQDRERSEVHLEFWVGKFKYKISRNAFESQALRFFEVSDSAGEIVISQEDGQSDEKRHDEYRARVVSDIGLSSFPQFVYLQHFLLTFDERRRTLFWDAENAEKILYLALGIDPEVAERADELRKRADGEDSLSRNAQYDATVARTRLNEIRTAAVEAAPESEPVSDMAITIDTAQTAYAEAADHLESIVQQLVPRPLMLFV